jgi:nicotinamide mononucleotide transporter
MIEWINKNWVEITGVVFSFVYLILEIKRNWIFWIVGIISSAFYVFIFFRAGLYAEMSLNFYYILMSVYGLYCWKFALKAGDENQGFQNIKKEMVYNLILFFIVSFVVVLAVLRLLPGAKVPLADALIGILSIIGTWLSAKKIVECWHIWIFVNIFATGLYIHQKLYPTAILFTFFSILSFIGLKEWRKSVK